MFNQIHFNIPKSHSHLAQSNRRWESMDCPVCTVTLIVLAAILVLAIIVAAFLAFTACRRDVTLVAPSPAHVAVMETPKTAYVAHAVAHHHVVGQSYLASSNVCQPTVQHVCQPSLQQVSIQTVPAPPPPCTTVPPSHTCIQPTSPSGQIYYQSTGHGPIFLRWVSSKGWGSTKMQNPEADCMVKKWRLQWKPLKVCKDEGPCNDRLLFWWLSVFFVGVLAITECQNATKMNMPGLSHMYCLAEWLQVLLKFQNASVLLLPGSWWTCFFLMKKGNSLAKWSSSPVAVTLFVQDGGRRCGKATSVTVVSHVQAHASLGLGMPMDAQSCKIGTSFSINFACLGFGRFRTWPGPNITHWPPSLS